MVNICNNTLFTVTIYSFVVIIRSLAHRTTPYCTLLTGHIVDVALCWLVKLSHGFYVPPVSWQSKEISETKLYAGATRVQPLRANRPGCVCECMHVYSLCLPTKSVHRLKNKECSTSTLPMHLAFNLNRYWLTNAPTCAIGIGYMSILNYSMQRPSFNLLIWMVACTHKSATFGR